jgi:hypothetical protein
MSGSGATCFGLFTDDGSAKTAAALARPGWRVAAAPLTGDAQVKKPLTRARKPLILRARHTVPSRDG